MTQLLRVSVTVAELGRTAGFYRDALGFEGRAETAWTDPARLRLIGLAAATRARSVDVVVGGQVVELVAFEPAGRPYPAARAANDQWFEHLALVTRDIAAAAQRVGRHPSGAITAGAPVVLPPNTGGVAAFKFRDPEGHPLELISFPEGVGAPLWQRGAATGIIGYDHTAIAVADLERSLSFYTGLLGFRIGGRSLNRGPEQDRLDGLQGCEVDVVALQPAGVATPHLELLHYRRPRGRVASGRVRADDVASARQVYAVEDLAALVARLRAGGAEVVSGGLVRLADGRAAAVLDPDGRMLVLMDAAPGR